MNRYEKIFTVRWADCDVNGHMRNTAYSEYAIDVRVGYLAEHGFGFERFVEEQIGPVLLREEIDYLREVRLGETITVNYTALGLSPDNGLFKLQHDFTKAGGKPCARIVLSGGWMDLRTRKLVPAPELLARIMGGVPRAEGFAELPRLEERHG
jgi:acyl-CoA thioester hydrolase